MGRFPAFLRASERLRPFLFFRWFGGGGLQIIRNPLQRFTFPVDIEPTARFKSPTKPAVADFSKRAVSHHVCITPQKRLDVNYRWLLVFYVPILVFENNVQ